MQALYAYYKHSGSTSMNDIEKELNFSIKKTFDLYHLLLLFVVDISDFAEQRIDIAKHKKLPSKEDLNPNMRFVENRIVAQIKTNTTLTRYLESTKLSWVNYPELIKGIYNELNEFKAYQDYMNSETDTYENDKSFIIKLYKDLISNYEPLYNSLEEQSIFWNDEIEFVISSIIKTLKKFNQKDYENAQLMPLFKSDDDKDFAKRLFRKVILNQADYRKYIEKFSQNWDFERIAFMDLLLIDMAIAEAIEFKSIPVKVTFNEYIELSKFYSTQRSNVFINGILDKIFSFLKESNIVVKQGRGLIGEV